MNDRRHGSRRVLVALLAALLGPMGSVAAGPAAAAAPLDLTRLLEPYRRFAEVDARLGSTDQAATRELSSACMVITLKCLRFLRDRPELARRAIPDNPEYWRRYAAALDAEPLPPTEQALASAPYQGFVAAANAWVWRALLDGRRPDPDRLHLQLAVHRQRLAESETLLERMVFTATLSITLSAVNPGMAGDHLAPAREHAAVLDAMLQPLDPQTRSLRRALAGERAHMEERQAGLQEPVDPNAWEDARRGFDYLAERSEVSWDDYWRNGVDIRDNVLLVDHELLVPQFHSHTDGPRYLDAMLLVLRGLREIYEGRASPGPPSLPAPYPWSWRWRTADASLCLEPGYVHASFGAPETLCYPYLSPWPGAAADARDPLRPTAVGFRQ